MLAVLFAISVLAAFGFGYGTAAYVVRVRVRSEEYFQKALEQSYNQGWLDRKPVE